MLDIYVSTMALQQNSIEDIVEIAKKNELAIEFSSGLSYSDNMNSFYANADIKRIPHNYFPAPLIPFVLNLASENDLIRAKSIEHCKEGLKLAKISNSPFYCAHAGFCIDPKPKELGIKIEFKDNYIKTKNKNLFLESVIEILKTADELGLDFLVENNVLASFNYSNNKNPLLCCESNEIKWLCESINHNRFGLLLDTAHLQISCKTLGLEKGLELESIRKYIKAIHHSDNDCFIDNNLSILNNYWFLPYMKHFAHIPHVLEVKNLTITEIHNQLKLLRNACN